MSDTIWVSIGIGLGSAAVLLFLIVLFVWCYRRRNRYEYTPIRDDVTLPTKWKMEKEVEEEEKKEAALLNCQFFLRANVGVYSYNEYLKQIGSRAERQWFIVRHVQMKKDLLLTVTPKSPHSQLVYDSSNSKALVDILQAIKHPYIWPVTDLVLQQDQQVAIVLQPYNSKGSLKDLIRNTRPQSAWTVKIVNQNKGLQTKCIQLYGCQILEALLYLKENNFPAHRHVQSGNIIVKNGVCHLSALDNMFLGYTSSIQQLLYRKIRNNIEALDVLCFGHLMFEMACGCDLDTAHPDSADYANCKDPAVKEILEFIFNKSKEYPSLDEVRGHVFFTSCNLIELKSNPPQPIKLSSGMKSILKVLHKSKLPKMVTENEEKKKSVQKQVSKNNVKQPNSSKIVTENEEKPVQKQASKNNVKEANSSKSKKKSDSEGRRRKTSNRTSTAPQVHPPPPPPVPSAPPPTPHVTIKQPSTSGPRTALLSEIRKGMALKKSETIDKSGPKV